MSEDKATYGKPDCKHESTTPIVNLPSLVRCNGCGEVMRPKRTRYEWLKSLSVEELAVEIFAARFLCLDCHERNRCPSPLECYVKWLKEEVEEGECRCR